MHFSNIFEFLHKKSKNIITMLLITDAFQSYTLEKGKLLLK